METAAKRAVGEAAGVESATEGVARAEEVDVANTARDGVPMTATATLEAPSAVEAWMVADAPTQYEYLDHTADVQLHSWGASLAEAFEQQVLAIMGLITELPTVRVEPGDAAPREVEVEGHDTLSLLYNFLDECLYLFNAELFVTRRLRVVELDRERFSIRALCVGERFELGRHPQGTEVKAITYSAMRITEEEGRVDVLVIVDI